MDMKQVPVAYFKFTTICKKSRLCANMLYMLTVAGWTKTRKG